MALTKKPKFQHNANSKEADLTRLSCKKSVQSSLQYLITVLPLMLGKAGGHKNQNYFTTLETGGTQSAQALCSRHLSIKSLYKWLTRLIYMIHWGG